MPAIFFFNGKLQFEVYISSILAPFDSILDPLWSIWAPLGHLGLIFGVFGHQRGSLRHQSGAKGNQKSPKRAPESPQRVPRSSKIPLPKKKKKKHETNEKNSIIHWVFAPKSGRKSRRTNCPRNPKEPQGTRRRGGPPPLPLPRQSHPGAPAPPGQSLLLCISIDSLLKLCISIDSLLKLCIDSLHKLCSSSRLFFYALLNCAHTPDRRIFDARIC